MGVSGVAYRLTTRRLSTARPDSMFFADGRYYGMYSDG